MQMITTSNLNTLRKEIKTLKEKKETVVVQAGSQEFNRKVVENKDVDIFLDPHVHDRKDYMKQRDSGLNEVLCKLAKQNNIKIGIDWPLIKKMAKKDKAIMLSRIKQNIDLCKRTKTQIIIYPKSLSNQEISSIFLSLGASTNQAKEASPH
ncbi:hypothetical protein GOV14_06185 [Candidatus Pacearchaeota archaeon]|nr:hypothetical protein [Candidatus Pacearchaeota archaeon]